MKASYIHIFLAHLTIIVGLLLASCTDDLIDRTGSGSVGEDVTVKLYVNVTTPEEKATTRIPDENVVFDLYILIFDTNGNKTGFGYFDDLNNGSTTSQPNTTGDQNYVTLETKTGPSYIYGIANISGAVNEYDYEEGGIKDLLDKVETRDDLLSFVAILRNETERVGNSYLMSGTAVNEGSDTYWIEKGEDIKTVQLRRLDSYITFNVKGGGNCTFQPTSYQVFNVPKKTYLIEHEAVQEIGKTCTWDGTCDEDGTDYFDTRAINIPASGSFSFWMVENRLNGKKEISDNDYSLREKEEKIDIEPELESKPTVTNGSYIYAPDNATYVVIKGHFTGNSTVENNEGPVEAEVVYTIHLGYVDNDANDFFSRRNTKYTYNVTVEGVDNIIVEVLAESPDMEPSPGAEGDVIFTNGTTKYVLDAHYETVLLRFSKDLLEHGNDVSDFFSYKINTPFASYISTDNNIPIRDEDWIRIVRNEKQGNYYSTDFQPYAIRQGYNGYQRNGMTLSQFIQDLQKIAKGEESDAYDDNNEVVYTCHIDEFYYEDAPRGVSISGDLWKKFVNVEPREVQILNDVELSADGESSITRSTYILSQRAIQTFFNTSMTASYSAYGVETVNETGPLYTWPNYPDQVGANEPDRDTGRDNFWGMLNELMGSGWRRDANWSTYVNFDKNGYTNVEDRTQTVNAMNDDYQKAYLACMQRNRDLDGDGEITEDEIKWYLPAINQYVGMFIGDGSLSEEAKLYTESKYVYKHYVSSTTNGTWPIIYWAEESVSESSGTEYNMAEYMDGEGDAKYTDYAHEGDKDASNRDRYVNHYRCMRNLGDGTPVKYYSKSGNSITIPYLDINSTRPRVRFGELGTHKSDEENSELYSGGFTYYNGWVEGHSEGYDWISANLGNVMNNTYTSCRYINNYTRGYWRAPNLRELYLMSINNALDMANVSQENAVSRTEFKFSEEPLVNSEKDTQSFDPNPMYRRGWFYNGTNLTMGNGSLTEGNRIRCVRDNN